MALFSFFKKTEEEISIILEIGSGSIGGALVRLSKINKPEIFYSVRRQISLDKDIDPDRMSTLMFKTLGDVCTIIQKEGLPHLDFLEKNKKKIAGVNFVLSSPWCLSQTKIATMEQPKPFQITKDVFNKLITEQEKVVSESALKTFADFHMPGDGKIIEKKIVQFKLNGYKVDEVVGKTASSLEMAMIVSVIPDGLIKKIEETVSQHFSFNKSSYHSFSLSSFSVIRDLFPDKDNFMFLDLSSEISDMSMVKDGVLTGSVSFPLGRNFFVRKIATGLAISIEETFSLISIFHHKNLDKTTTEKISAILTEAMNEWVAEMQKSLALLAREVYIPRTIFKITNDDFGMFFANRLRQEKFSQFGFTDENFDLAMLDSSKFNEHCRLAKTATTDSFIYMNCLFLNKIYNLS